MINVEGEFNGDAAKCIFLDLDALLVSHWKVRCSSRAPEEHSCSLDKEVFFFELLFTFGRYHSL